MAKATVKTLDERYWLTGIAYTTQKGVSIKYTERNDTGSTNQMAFACKQTPHSDFEIDFQNIKKVAAEIIKLPTGRITVTELKLLGDSDNGREIQICGFYLINGLEKETNALIDPDAELEPLYFAFKTPKTLIGMLTGGQEAIITNAQYEAVKYIDGKRGDAPLFDDLDVKDE